MHNVRIKQINTMVEQCQEDASAAQLDFNFEGTWCTNSDQVQFSGDVQFPQGELTLNADFPPFLGGEGRAPSALTYCFYGAMSCYGSTFATQAAMAGVTLDAMIYFIETWGGFPDSFRCRRFPSHDRV